MKTSVTKVNAKNSIKIICYDFADEAINITFINVAIISLLAK